MTRPTTHTCGALAIAMLAMPVSADIIEVRYDFPANVNTSLLYGYFGGDEPVVMELAKR